MNNLNKSIFEGNLVADASVVGDSIYFTVANNIKVNKTTEELAEEKKSNKGKIFPKKSIPSILKCRLKGKVTETFPLEILSKGCRVLVEARQTTYKKEYFLANGNSVKLDITINNVDSVRPIG